MKNIKEYFEIRKKAKDLDNSYINCIECIEKIDKMGNAKLLKPSKYEVQYMIDTVKSIQRQLLKRKPTIKEEIFKNFGYSDFSVVFN